MLLILVVKQGSG